MATISSTSSSTSELMSRTALNEINTILKRFIRDGKYTSLKVDTSTTVGTQIKF